VSELACSKRWSKVRES